MMWFLLGLIFWQAISTAVLFLTKEDEEKTIRFSCGIFTIIVMLAKTIIEYISLKNFKKHYNLYLFSHMGSNVDRFYMTPQTASLFNLTDKDAPPTEWVIRLIRNGSEFKSLPSYSEVLTEKEIETGINGLSPTYIKKFLKN